MACWSSVRASGALTMRPSSTAARSAASPRCWLPGGLTDCAAPWLAAPLEAACHERAPGDWTPTRGPHALVDKARVHTIDARTNRTRACNQVRESSVGFERGDLVRTDSMGSSMTAPQVPGQFQIFGHRTRDQRATLRFFFLLLTDRQLHAPIARLARLSLRATTARRRRRRLRRPR